MSYRTLFSISLPLVLSMAATTVMEFTDRVFLANYDIDAIAAAGPAGITAYLFLSFFTGVASYLNVFIAQYTGAGDHSRIGPCVWQGVYFAMAATLLLIGISLLAGPLFRWGGHAPEIQRLERIYFQILCVGGGINVLGAGLAGFFTGRGQTRPVLAINTIGMCCNIPLDYALINGIWIFPEMGIAGAGIATVSSWALITLLYAILIFTNENERIFAIKSQRAFDLTLSTRIITKGAPASLQFCIDIFAFTFFIFMVGRLGSLELAVSNIAFSIESIAFMPAYGFSMGLSTLVGQSLGRNDIGSALLFTRQTFYVLMSYILLVGLLFLFIPERIFGVFVATENGRTIDPQLLPQGVMVIRIVAAFIAFDAMYFTFVGVLKGAGDNRFIMWSIGIATITVMIIPLIIAIEVMRWGLFACWIILMAYIVSLFAVSLIRFLQGKWQTIRVI